MVCIFYKALDSYVLHFTTLTVTIDKSSILR